MDKKIDQEGFDGSGKVKRSKPFSVVPNEILKNSDLSFAARVTMAYMVGRPENWKFYVQHVCKTLGIGSAQWKAVRKELVKAGYMRQTRSKDAQGRFAWSLEVSDVPVFNQNTDSPPIDGQATDGVAIGGGERPIKRINEFNDCKNNKCSSGFPSINRLLVIENGADAILVKAMIDEYGCESVEGAVAALIAAGERAYPSFVRRYLSEEKRKVQQKARELQIKKNQEVAMDQDSREKGEDFLASVRKKRRRGG
ncbi:hydantoinase B/oxoprolinase family protein [Chromobacterium vaccinii]|nr:hydantoinase B/oxoprolinase family protein [Chromobacterium vaccinii]